MSLETFSRLKPSMPIGNPPTPEPDKGDACKNAGSNEGFVFEFTGADQAKYYWVIYSTPPQPQGRMSIPKSQYVLLKSVENVGLLGVVDFTTEYTARFGQIEVGDLIGIFVKYIYSDTGQVFEMGEFPVRAKDVT